MTINCGWYSNLYEDIVGVHSIKQKAEFDSVGFRYAANTIFTDTPEIDHDQAIHLKEFYFYETISGRKAKLGFPKKVGTGRCLIHFPDIGDGKTKLSIDIACKDSTTQQQVYEVFKSIKFKK